MGVGSEVRVRFAGVSPERSSSGTVGSRPGGIGQEGVNRGEGGPGPRGQHA